jgi:hypothetical protein
MTRKEELLKPAAVCLHVHMVACDFRVPPSCITAGRSPFQGSGVLAAGSRPHSRIQQWSLQVSLARTHSRKGLLSWCML